MTEKENVKQWKVDENKILERTDNILHYRIFHRTEQNIQQRERNPLAIIKSEQAGAGVVPSSGLARS